MMDGRDGGLIEGAVGVGGCHLAGSTVRSGKGQHCKGQGGANISNWNRNRNKKQQSAVTVAMGGKKSAVAIMALYL